MEHLVTRNPTAPSEVVSRVVLLADAELDAKLTASVAPESDWVRDASRRAIALGRWADRVAENAGPLAELVTREVGKPIAEARAEVARTEAILRYYAQAPYDPIGEVLPGASALSEIHVRQEPLGAVVAVTPWNFPLAIPTWKVAPALAYGNTVILKAASAAIGCAQELVALSRPDVPESVLFLAAVTGKTAGELIPDQRVGGVSFTGSTAVGAEIVQRATLRGIPVQAEMGGFNSVIVLDDADLVAATSMIVAGAMGFAGQKCTATRRVLVAPAIADALTTRLADVIGGLVAGDPRSDDVVVGPLIDKAAVDAFAERVGEAEQRGATLLARGGAPNGTGWFVPPTLIAVDGQNPFSQQETFGPALAIQRVESVGDAIAAANATPFGLCAAVHSQDIGRAWSVAEALDVGMVRINGPTTGVDFWAPFGGEKASSYGGREQGRAVRAFYLRTKTVTVPRPS